MTSVGIILKTERERQGREPAEIAEELCITQRYLRAIEQDDLGSLPGTFFYKSFVKQYAAILGVDEMLLKPGVESLTAEAESVAFARRRSALRPGSIPVSACPQRKPFRNRTRQLTGAPPGSDRQRRQSPIPDGRPSGPVDRRVGRGAAGVLRILCLVESRAASCGKRVGITIAPAAGGNGFPIQIGAARHSFAERD